MTDNTRTVRETSIETNDQNKKDEDNGFNLQNNILSHNLRCQNNFASKTELSHCVELKFSFCILNI